MNLTNKIGMILDEFADEYSSLTGISTEEIKSLCNSSIKYYNGKIVENPLGHLDKLWFDGQEAGINNYNVYGHRDYYAEAFACWYIYSSKYLKRIFDLEVKSPDVFESLRLDSVDSIIDLGNGLGFTTLMIARHFRNAKIYGTNLKDTLQWEFCSKTNHGEYELIQDYSTLGHIDIVFASEYFEHIENCLEHVSDIVDKISPRIMVIANSFNTRGIGHIYNYLNYGQVIHQSLISKQFIKKMISLGYAKVPTKFWNQSPNVYVKVESGPTLEEFMNQPSSKLS